MSAPSGPYGWSWNRSVSGKRYDRQSLTGVP